MASSKVLVLSVVIFSVLAIGLQISGLLTPGWFIYKADVTEVETLPMIFRQMILFERNDQPEALPQESNNPQQELDASSSEEFKDVEPRPWGGPNPRPPPHHHHHHHHPTPRSDDMNPQNPVNSPVVGVEEDLEIDQVQVVKYEVSVHIGLWYARGCLHVDTDPESNGEKKKGRCNCTAISIDDAMKLMKNEPQITDNDMQRGQDEFIFFIEMRIEAATGSVFALIGFVIALVGFKKESRPVIFLTSAMMLTSCILVFIPILRIGMANHEIKRTINMMNKMSEEEQTDVKVTGKLICPYSLMLSGSGMIAAFILCLLLSISSCIKSRRSAQGRWTRFYDEYAGGPGAKMDPSKEKFPELTLHFGEEAEPLPEKVALA
ncbi:hypothetical protein CHS0354_029775 [Potamilus streckersoni]|uniref:Uncharacterized protein n=1 Tax=Potamilus streckersoni TaxID=2493646 RepID=A0AAE0THY9_9BIVA|nr:hypothetical protein CHS0354_029775 [Potamilus streckersoni]